jgi:ABC-type antimicrobial peptide transport system permease subunit
VNGRNRRSAGRPRPRLAEWLLKGTLPAGVRGRSIKGDPDQEHDELRQRSPGRRYDLWYTWESIKLAARFGAVALTKRGDENGVGRMERLAYDLRYAFRRTWKNPGFALVAILTIAIGIGANVAIFSVVNAVVLKPLPYRDAGELVAIWEHRLESGNDKNVANPGNVRDWRDRAASFESVAAVSMSFPGVLDAADGPVEIQAVGAEAHFFDVLGVEPAVGGFFNAEAAGNQFVLTNGFWRQEYGSDPTVVGRTARLNGRTGEIVGVLPDEYLVWSEDADLYFFNAIEGADRTNSGRWLQVIGRMNDGVTLAQARAEMLAIAAQLQEEDPGFNAGWSVNVISLKEEVVGDVRSLMMILLGAVGLLLLIACANVANLLLARGTGRQQEMAVRTSMGASSGTLGRQLLVEAAALAGIGAFLGLVLAHYGSMAIVGAMPAAFGLPRAEAVGFDLWVVAFALLATIVTAVLFGVLPAVQASRVAPAAALSGEARGPSRKSGRARNALVVAPGPKLLQARGGRFGTRAGERDHGSDHPQWRKVRHAGASHAIPPRSPGASGGDARRARGGGNQLASLQWRPCRHFLLACGPATARSGGHAGGGHPERDGRLLPVDGDRARAWPCFRHPGPRRNRSGGDREPGPRRAALAGRGPDRQAGLLHVAGHRNGGDRRGDRRCPSGRPRRLGGRGHLHADLADPLFQLEQRGHPNGLRGTGRDRPAA